MLNEAEVGAGRAARPRRLLTACPAERWLPPAIVATLHAGPRRARAPGGLARRGARRSPRPPPRWRPTSRACCRGSRSRSASWARSIAPRRWSTARGGRWRAGAPALAWADAAVSLGRGRASPLPVGRAARRSRGAAAGGPRQPGGGRRRRAVGARSTSWGAEARAHDADLAELARLRRDAAAPRTPRATIRCARSSRGCARGSTASSTSPAERLRHALSGHGDACRAAGEYRATLRALKQKPDAAVFAPLRAENAGLREPTEALSPSRSR